MAKVKMASKYEGTPCRRCGGTVRFKSNGHCVNKGCSYVTELHLYHVRELIASNTEPAQIVQYLREMFDLALPSSHLAQ